MSQTNFGKGNSTHSQGTNHKLLIVTVCFLLLIGMGCNRALNAGSDSTVRSTTLSLSPYYAKVDSTTVGTLKQSLHDLIKQHRVLPYRSIWAALESIEQTGNSPGFIRLFYSRRAMPANNKASGRYQSENDFWNREHVWPQSKGIKKTSAKTDLHNIVAADRSINASRGNKYFDYGGKLHSECERCRTDRNSWEPPDETKGDVARMLFYMELRYDGSDNSGVGDLRLVNKEHMLKRNQLGSLATLLRWHCQDSVSAYEVRRNNIIYELQGNRNPFVDLPELVSKLYGQHC